MPNGSTTWKPSVERAWISFRATNPIDGAPDDKNPIRRPNVEHFLHMLRLRVGINSGTAGGFVERRLQSCSCAMALSGPC